MDARLNAQKAILVQDDLYVIRAERRVVWVQLVTPPNIDPRRGAAAAGAIATYLLGSVLERRSSWLGLILDVRQGPTVMGPLTLALAEQIFQRAEEVRKPLAALIGPAPAQREQFSALQRAHAPRFALATEDAKAAADWMTRAG
jgi:hypothetical protein